MSASDKYLLGDDVGNTTTNGWNLDYIDSTDQPPRIHNAMGECSEIF